ncbi:dihydropteroate synthase [Caenibacillus caldisaponilyticus]|uniref:dihydropteroate synthase n=1 Tax=Caenibacillus caldisaponilyticus TaxID=1674942 RepID=UPI0009888142|nr:dihydropteroate synthase [Caenibacillus caldisaponilyticus]
MLKTIAKHRHQIVLKNRVLNFKNRTLIMGILNVTPDSFSDGGRYNRVDKAVQHALEMIEDGADIIDIGGESTRPGHEPVPADIEMERVIPVIRAIREVSDVPISIDTYKAVTARAALEAGADIINDVWGAKADPEMAKTAALYDAPIILMHNRRDAHYDDLIEDMKKDLLESIEMVKRTGVTDDKIILDPGIGFAKTYKDNLTVMRHLEAFHELGYPILLATSRKSFIGKTLNAEVDERLEGTGATVCLGIAKGCHMVRVHDVKPIAKMVKMMDAMLYDGGEE